MGDNQYMWQIVGSANLPFFQTIVYIFREPKAQG